MIFQVSENFKSSTLICPVYVKIYLNHHEFCFSLVSNFFRTFVQKFLDTAEYKCEHEAYKGNNQRVSIDKISNR